AAEERPAATAVETPAEAPAADGDSTVQVLLPELGESVTEGQIVGWRVSEGDVVEAGQTLLDVTTDKVDVEVPAPRAGRVTRLLAAEGDTVTVGAPLAELAPAQA